ncbi:MAG: hypothetical protein RL220_422 [Bacteroidota bacterium]
MKTHQLFILLFAFVLLNPSRILGQEVQTVRVYLDDNSEPFSVINIPPGDNVNENISINLSNISRGVHRLFLEVVDTEGNVSHKVRKNVLIEGAIGMATLTSAEYYFDEDPGFGNGYAMIIPEGASVDEDIYLSIPAELSKGVHRLFVRVMDGGGQWSHVVRKNILVEGALNMGELTGIEYFFDSDPGFGNGLSVISPGGSAIDADLMFTVPNDLSLGQHDMYVRVQDGGGQWSHYVYKPVIICDMIVPEITVEGELCAPANATISVPAIYESYIWSDGGTSNLTIPSTSGTYFVTVDDGDCSVTVYIDIEFYELPVPSISVSENTLTCSEAGYEYVWYLNGEIIPGANSQTYEATEDGLYSVMITLEGCYQYSEEIDFTYIGVDELSSEFIRIFPNPSSGSVNIVPAFSEKYNLTMIDASGSTVFILNNCTGQQIIDVSRFASGLYEVQLYHQDKMEVRQLQIVK